MATRVLVSTVFWWAFWRPVELQQNHWMAKSWLEVKVKCGWLSGVCHSFFLMFVIAIGSSSSKLWPQTRPPCPHAVAVLPPLPPLPPRGNVMGAPPPREMLPPRRQPPSYNMAAQMARLHRIGRAHSHEGVSGGYYMTEPEEDDDEDAQVSAV